VTRAFEWKPTGPTVFTKAATGCGCAQRRRGGDAHFRSFWRFFLTRLSLGLAKIEEKKEKHRQLIASNVAAATAAVPLLKRRPFARCEHVLVLRTPSVFSFACLLATCKDRLVS